MITLLGGRKTSKDGIHVFMGIRSVDKRVILDVTLLALADHTSGWYQVLLKWVSYSKRKYISNRRSAPAGENRASE